MTSKIVRINLKVFIEDMFIALSTKDEEAFKELDEKLTHIFSIGNDQLKDSILYYIKQTKLVYENEILQRYFSKFSI